MAFGIGMFSITVFLMAIDPSFEFWLALLIIFFVLLGLVYFSAKREYDKNNKKGGD